MTLARYPVSVTQPYSGDPFPYDQGPPDALPSASYVEPYLMTKGRYLGGIGHDPGAQRAPMLPGNAPTADGPDHRDYPNELEMLAHMDDVQGNGVFDPPGAHPNIHPDSGVFGDRESLPGYIAREESFVPSEVLDITSGNRVMYIPGNSFMLDPRTDQTLAARSLYLPGMPRTGGEPLRHRSIVIPNDGAWPVGASEVPAEPASSGQMFAMAAFAGLAIGLVAGLMAKKGR